MTLLFGKPDNSPSIFGSEEVSGVVNLVNPHYPHIIPMIHQFHGTFWTELNFKLDNDSLAFKGLGEGIQKVFTTNLQWQICADSIFADVIGSDLAEQMVNMEFKTLYRLIANHENLHARSYSYIVQSLYPNPNIIFDEIRESSYIKGRIQSLNEGYAEGMSLQEKLLVNLFAEGVSFPTSFMITAVINRESEGGLSQVNGIIQDIEREETLHVAAGVQVIKTILSKDYKGEQVFTKDNFKIQALVFANKVRQQERAAIKHLASLSPVIAVNEFNDYIDYKIAQILQAIDVDPVDFLQDSTCYLGELENKTYKERESTKIALQETDGKYSISQTTGKVTRKFEG